MQNSLEKDVNNPDKLCIFTSILSKKVSDYFGDDEHRKQFEEWYRKSTGKSMYGVNTAKMKGTVTVSAGTVPFLLSLIPGFDYQFLSSTSTFRGTFSPLALK